MFANPLKRFFDQAKFKARIWRTLRSGPSELPRPDRIIIDLSHCCDLSCPDCNRSCAVDQAPAEEFRGPQGPQGRVSKVNIEGLRGLRVASQH